MDESNIIDDVTQVHERARAASFDFLIQELELGLTFCRIALTDDFTNLARRHHADADKAYQTAVRLVDALALTDKERKLFDEKEHELRLLLAEFGSQNR